MNYDYKIIDVDPNKRFLYRALLYLAILLSTVGVALVILLILFERYLTLILPVAFFLVSAIISILVGKQTKVYSYHFTENALKIEGKNGLISSFDIADLLIIKNASKSDFFDKRILKFAFFKSRIVLKNTLNNNNLSPEYFIVSDNSDRKLLLALDEYALALFGGVK